MNIDVIKNLLRDISQFEILEIIDNSKLHSGHAGIKNTIYDLTHIKIRLINQNNLKKIDIHRTIYQKLDSEIKKGLHSVEIIILDN